MIFGAAIGYGAMRLSQSSSQVELAVMGAGEGFAFAEKGNLKLAEGKNDEATWRQMVESGKVDGLLKINASSPEGFVAELIVRKEPAWLEELRPAMEAEKLRWEILDAQIPINTVERLLSPSKIDIVSLSAGETSKGDRMIAYGLLVAMLLTSWIGLAYMMTGITGEKQMRVTEQVVSAIRPQAWIDGKLLGISGAAIGSLAFLFVTGLVCVPAAFLLGMDIALPGALKRWDLLPLFLVYYLGGVFFWNCFYAAVAAVINDPNTSSRTSLLFLPMLPMMAAGFVVSKPDGTMMSTLSILPGASSTAMPMRMILGEVSYLEIISSILIMLLGILVLRTIAGRVFAAGIMLYGKEPNWIDIFKWSLTKRVDTNGLPVVSAVVMFCCLSFTVGQTGSSQDAAPKSSASNSQEIFDLQVQLASFDTVWNTIKEVHWDETLAGKKWDSLREELRPKIEQASSIEEVRGILSQIPRHHGVHG